MNDRTRQVIDFNASDQQQVAVQPNAELVLTGIDFEDVAVDIIDTDVILSNPETGDRLVLLGLAIYLFDEEEVPLMSFEGEEVSPNLLLSKVGAIDNLTMQEFVAVSSLLADSFKKSEEEKDKDKEDEESDEQSESTSDVMAAILQAIESMNEAQQAAPPEVDVSSDDGKYDRKAVDEEGDSFLVNIKTASADSSAAAAAPSEAPEVPEAEILFDIFLLQPTRIETREAVDDVEFRHILGGGGSEESGFNPDNDAQFSTEVLNYGTASDDLTIQTDNPALFDANTMTRVIEMTPTFPAGYDVTQIAFTGFPDGFQIDGGSKVGDTWLVESPEFDERGAVRINLIYSVPSDESFSVDVSLTAEFQEGTLNSEGIALTVPSEVVLVSGDSREFVVREVFSANDLNFVNADGEEVWVLANSPNPNRVFSGSGDDQITGSVGVDFIQGGSGDDTIDGGAGTDTLNGESGDDFLIHGEGFDTFIGGSGVDTLDYSGLIAPIQANLAEQVDGFANILVDPDGSESEVDQVKGVENIIAGSGNDILTGDREDNHLKGNGGEDRLTGGGGNDILDGGDDFDIADYSDSTGPIAANLALDTDNVTIDESNVDTLISIEHVVGSEFDDDLVGGQDDDTFSAGAGDDRLAGGEGSDTLDGGEGDRDFADFSGTADGVNVDLGGSTDNEGFVIATHGANADRLKNIEDLVGSQHDDQLTGNELAQFIMGGDGDDIIDGAAGADTLDGGIGQDQIDGGAGDDTFIHSDGNDRLDGGSDLDTIDFSLTDNITSVDARLDGNTESLIQVTGGDDLTVSNVENIIGTAGDDRLQGDASDNILDGRDGDDILIGAAGDDALIGGEGSDSADYSVATVGVNIDLSAGVVTNDGFGGRDSIDGIENLTGSDFDDSLAGDAQDNVLSGGEGDDVLTGRAGNDLLSGGEGQDAASYEFSRAAVAVDLAADEPTQDGEGGEDTFDSIESVIGSALNDTLYGNEEDNSLSGLAGDDILDGRAGADTLIGGTGNDLLMAGEGSDTFDGGVGVDVLDFSKSLLATSISLSLSGSDYIQITVNGGEDDQVRNVESIIGTAGDDVLRGDALSNTLRGEDGDDVISGGTGSDTLSGGSGDDQLRFDDLTSDGVSLSLVTNTASYDIDGSTDTFSGFERYATTNQDDVILSSEGEDLVEGLGGEDHFYSSQGSDQFFGDEGDDIVDYSNQDGIDHIEATLDEGRTITINVVGGDDDQVTSMEGIVGSAGDDLLTGDSLDNQLSGSGGDDFLDGGEGDDTLFGDAGQDRFLGGAGADTYEGGAGSDVIDYSLAKGGISVDLALNTAINDGFDSEDTIFLVENIIGTSDRDVITGDGRINTLIGGAGNDVIRGGTGSDTLDGGDGDSDEVHFDDLVNFGVTLDLEAGTAFFSGDVSTDILLGFEVYFATAQDDQILGSEKADTVYGSAGDDLFLASSGADILDGGSESDSLDYSALDAATYVNVTLDGSRTVDVEVGGVGTQRITRFENVTGTDGADTLGGDALSNTLIAGAGDDSIFGGAGSDLLEGGAGIDELRFDELGAVGITLTLGAAGGTATYTADNSTDTFSGFERYITTKQDDEVNTSDNVDSIFTLAGDDQILASLGADSIDGGLGSDSIDYSGVLGASSIQLQLDNATPVQVTVAGADNQSISNIENVTGTSGDDTIIGDGQVNALSGLGGADTLKGQVGDDLLSGGQGDDHLSGGEGNDVLEGDQGRDTVSYSDATGGVSVDLALGVAANDGFGGADVMSGIEDIEGSVYADLLRGNSSGNDISADAGDDVVYGGLGSDTLSGGAHVLGDTLRFDDLSGAGIDLDLVLSRATFTGDLSVDTFSGFERYLLTDQNDTAKGSGSVDQINTLGGNDELSASAGSDVLDGGTGSDTLNYAGLSGISGVAVNLNGSTETVVTVSGGDDDTISNIENIVGTAGSDALGGDANDNRLAGMAGSDQFSASAGNDELLGGEGSDTLDYSLLSSAGSIDVTLAGTESTVVSVVGSGNDTISGIENLVGTAGDDRITGDDEQNLLEGRAGDDSLDGGAGADTLLGGDGSDFFTGSSGADVSDGGAGTDTIDFSSLDSGQSIDLTLNGSDDATVEVAGGDDQTIRNMENVIATSGDDRITGDMQDNNLKAQEGDDVLGASGGRDTLDGGAGEDTVDYSGLAGVQRINVVLDGANQATVQVSGGADDLIVRIENIIGTAGNDTLTGDSLDNILEGRLGNDTLAGGAGNDTLDGGSGVFVDTVSYVDVDSGVTVDLSAGIATEDGFGSVDTLIDIEQLTGSKYADNLTSATDTQRIDSAGGDDQIILGLGAISVDGGTGSDTVDYSALSAGDAISVELDGLSTVTLSISGSDDQSLAAIENVIGGQGDDVLTGDNNRNLLDGGIGDDTLQGLGGDDTLIGGVGNDRADYSQAGGAVYVDLQANRATADGDGGEDILSGIENLSGSNFDDVLKGDANDNSLFGNGGSDSLTGGAGIDVLDGGSGRDTVDYSAVTGSVVADLAANAVSQDGDGSNDSLVGIEDIIGSAQDDILFGDSGDNTLNGGQGDDLLQGRGGFDTLSGGEGSHDIADYSEAVSQVVVNLATNSATQDGDGSFDTLSGVEDVRGSANNDQLTGDAGSNRLEGGAGADTLIGAAGNDVIDGGAGLSDTVDYSAALNPVIIDLEAGQATEDGYLALDTVVNVENVIGSNSDDIIAGNTQANRLEGREGDDTINATAGTDTVDGGDGSDTLDYSGLAGINGVAVSLNGASTATVTVSGGDDDRVLNVENVVGSAGNDVLGGDVFDNQLEGQDGEDRFIASGGADEMHGGAGSDTLDYSTFSSASSISVNLQGTGMTTVTVDGSNDDRISGIENVVGTTGNDRLAGDDQQNTLEGRAGDDILDGGVGNDTLLGGDGSDLVTASDGADISDGGAGVDTIDYSGIASGQSIDLTLNGSSDAVVTVTGGDDQTVRNIENVIASSGDDQVTGDSQQNFIQTMDGDDLIGASGGSDTLDGGAGLDTADYSRLAEAQRITVELGGENETTIQVSGSADDRIVRVENIIGTSGDDSLTGDSQDNILEGRLGNDTLVGGAGNDTLDGGSGAFVDTVSYLTAAAGVTADLSTGLTSEDGFGNVDTLTDIEQLIGSNFADDLTAGLTTQFIDSAAGADWITLGLGVIDVDGGVDSDTVDYSELSAANAISVQLDGLNTVTVSVNGSDDQTLTSIENVTGSQGDDVITGDNSVNILDGGAGDDILQGRSGDDTLIGGAGVDGADYSQASGAVNVDLAINRANSDGDAGTDTLSGIENLSGSNFDDVLKGDASENTLLGNGGNDTLIGGAGLDVLDGGSGRDVANYSAVTGSVEVDLAGNTASQDGDGDSDTLLRIEDVVGSGQDDRLFGDAGANTLTGGLGEDVLRGAGGNDTLHGGDGSSDVADYSQATGQVVVNLGLNSASSDGDGSFDTLSGIENVVGSANDDQLTGDAGSNVLEGGVGADTLVGGGSNDMLDGGAGLSDTVDYSVAPGAINIDLASGSASADGYAARDTVLNVENVIGSALNDFIAGDAQVNRLEGGAGNDQLSGRGGIDTLIGGAGVDTADYSTASSAVTVNLASAAATDDGDGASDILSSIENVTGSDGNDDLTGDFQNNQLDGGAGDDTLRGAAGQDVLIGGAGINTADYSAASSDVSANLTTGQASMDGDNSSDTLQQIQNLTGSLFDDILIGDAANNRLEGGNRDDILEGRGGDDILDGGAGNDTVDYRQAVSSVVVNLATNTTAVDGDGGVDTLNLVENVLGSAGADSITGDGNANSLSGDEGDDLLIGAAGNDSLNGGGGTDTADYSAAASGINASLDTGKTTNDGDGGNDTLTSIENLTGSASADVLQGNAGSNVLRGGKGDDTLSGFSGNDLIQGGAGTNTVDYADANSGVTVDLALQTTDDDGYGFIDTLQDIQNVLGSDHDDIITGDAAANELVGQAGDDILLASAGMDFLDGAAGTDTADYSRLTGVTGVTIALNGTVDSVAFVETGDNDTLSNIENLTGSTGDDDLSGDSQINRILGGEGDDVIHGGSGSDFLDGGAHTSGDQLRFDDLNAVGVELDLVANTAKFAADGSTDVFTGFESYVLTQQDDTIAGSVQADIVSSLGGADEFSASGGTDTFDGGLGSDTLDYSALNGIGSIIVTLAGTSATTVQVASGENDSIASIENIIATDSDDVLTGDAEDNYLQGNDGNDTLDGGAGRDVLTGNDGDDRFIASDDENTYEGGAGIDTVDYSTLTDINSISATLGGSSTTTITVNGGSNDFARDVENLIGTSGNDTLVGDSADNRLDGSGGDDILEGRGGADTLIGGVGIDTIDYSGFGAAQEISVALNGEFEVAVTVNGDGTDTVSEVENVIGSGGADTLIGDAFANVLDGGAGDDVLTGGAGADTLKGGDGADTVDYSLETGINFISVQLNGSNEVTATVDGADNDTLVTIENVIGTVGNDRILGGGSVNVIEGRGGDDFIRGGLSNDTLDGGTGNNTISFSDSNSGITTNMSVITGGYFDITHGSSELDRAVNFINIDGSGGSDDITGDGNDNRIDGLAGEDILYGADGNDTLLGGGSADQIYGGAGNDKLYGNNGNDVLTGGDGDDEISGAGGEDTINAGEGLDTIDGGAGNDILDYSVHSGASAINVTLAGSTPATVTVTGSDDDDSVTNVEQIRGTDGADTIIGDDNDNVLYGGAGDDTLSGGLGTNEVYGEAGADTFLGTGGQNSYYGGADSDTVDYSSSVGVGAVSVTLDGNSQTVATLAGVTNDLLAEIENVIGTAGNDVVYGDDQDNHLQTLEGTDYIAGGAGDDILDGGDGTDTVNYVSAAAGVNLDLASNTASDDGDGGVDTLYDIENVAGSLHDDIIAGDANVNTLSGNLGDDTFIVTLGADIINGFDGTDTVDFSQQAGITGVEIALASGFPVTAIVTGGHDQSIRNVENVTGSGGNDSLKGDDLANHLQGLGGDDLLAGGLGNDVLDGGTGNNTVTYVNTTLSVTADMSTAVAGSYNATVGSSGEIDQLINVTNLVGSAAADRLTGDASENDIRGGDGADTIHGGDGIDILYGDAGDDIIDGGLGDDFLYGGAGNYDKFNDSEGVDTYDGGSGIYDRVSYLTSPGVTSISVDLDGSSVTTVTVNGVEGDTLVNIEFVIGTNGNDSFTGDNARNDFWGEDGEDVFYGSNGSDNFRGDGGADIADYSAFSANISGTMSSSFSLSKAGVGTDGLYSIETLITGEGADSIITGSNSTLLQTNGGDDSIEVRAGGVTVETGDGRDSVQISSSGADLVLGAGNDFVNVTLAGLYTFTADGGDGDDVFQIRGGGIVIDGGDQVDEVDYFRADSGLSVVLVDVGDSTATVGVLDSDTLRNVENIKGTTLNDNIAGNTQDNELSGSGGDDNFIASAGADVIDGGEGTDSIDYSSFAATNFITASLDEDDVSIVTVDGRADQSLSGIENLTGTSGNDTLTGDGQANRIDGSAGNDHVIGSAGSDVLAGGAGVADLLDYSAFTTSLDINFQFGTAQDGDGSTDTFSGFEQYILTAQSDIISGSNLSDNLGGEAGDDYFYASADADILDGGVGIDTLDYSTLAITGVTFTLNESDQVVVNVSDGDNDTISGFEKIIGSVGSDTITGDALDNAISGYAGDDVLDGGAGSDTISGDTGNDRLIASIGSDSLDGGDGSDTVDFSELTVISGVKLDLDGVSVVNTTVDGGTGDSDSIVNIENIIGSDGDDDLTGDDNANEISGGLGTDVLEGEAGDDILSGNAGDDTLIGGTGADTLSGGTGVDDLAGGDGADILAGGAGDDKLSGGNDDDLLQGDAGIDKLYGDAGADILDGGADDDILSGGADNDTLTGGSGNDWVQGDDGDDSLITGDGSDRYEGGSGVDTLDYSNQATAVGVSVILNGSTDATVTVSGDLSDTINGIENIVGTSGIDVLTGDSSANVFTGGVGNDQLAGGAGNDTLLGGDGNDALDGGADNDALDGGAGNDTLTASAGTDSMDGGAGIDLVDYSSFSGGVTVALNGANVATASVAGKDDTIVNIENVTGSSGDDILSGDLAANTLSGGLGDDTLSGGAGNDVLAGDAGEDKLDGGAGKDTLNGGTGNDLILASEGGDTIDGGADVDTLDYSVLGSATSVSIVLNGATPVTAAVTGGAGNNLVSNIENIIGTTGADNITGDSNANSLVGGNGNDTLSGGAGNDSLDGGAGGDVLTGGAGADAVSGGAGADLLMAGEGMDTYDGGDDSDTLDYSAYSSASAVEVTLKGSVFATISVTGAADNDQVKNVENIIGTTGADKLTGDAAANELTGGGGDDQLAGAGGDDILTGGAGNDTLSGNEGADTVLGGDGSDLLMAGEGADSFDGGNDVDTLNYSLHGSATSINVTLTGGISANVLIGGASDNDTVSNVENIVGSMGNDIITGDTNDNELIGSIGNDQLTGAAGNDLLEGGGGHDTLDGGDDDDTLLGGAGVDSLTGGAGVDSLSGGNGDDDLDGGAGIDTLDGGTGNDILDGGTGNDFISGGDGVDTIIAGEGVDTIDGGGGIDTIDYSAHATASSIDVTLDGANDADVTVAASSDVDTIKNVENVTGTSGNDVITGDAGQNVLKGGAGADTLSGGDGSDSLDGGAGNDTLIGGAGNDSLQGGADTDTVDYSGSGNAITGGTIHGTGGTIVQGAESDILSTIEGFKLTAQDDLLSFDVESLATASVDAGAGNDTVGIDSSVSNVNLSDASIEGLDLANIFTNVETIDFSKTSLNEFDKFVIGNSDINSITGGSNTLNISVDLSTITLEDVSILAQSGASITGNSTDSISNTRTVDWSDGVQLIING